MEGEANFDRTRKEDVKRLRSIMNTISGRFKKKPIIVRAFLNKARPMQIWTLEGLMTCNVGDWLIEGINGEFYPCKPDIFEKTYEEVEEKKASREAI